jgi:hypothetical protein
MLILQFTEWSTEKHCQSFGIVTIPAAGEVLEPFAYIILIVFTAVSPRSTDSISSFHPSFHSQHHSHSRRCDTPLMCAWRGRALIAVRRCADLHRRVRREPLWQLVHPLLPLRLEPLRHHRPPPPPSPSLPPSLPSSPSGFYPSSKLGKVPASDRRGRSTQDSQERYFRGNFLNDDEADYDAKKVLPHVVLNQVPTCSFLYADLQR